MRINFLLPHASLAGGVRVVAIYADRLRKRGHEVTVVSTPRRQPSARERLRTLIKQRRWPNAARPLPSHFDGLDVDHRVIDHPGPITDFDVPDGDVVIATWWETAEWVAALLPSKGAKAYFVQHDERVIVSPELRPRVAATYRLPLHKITIAQWLREMARDQFNDHDVALVPNSVDTSQFFAPRRTNNADPTVGFLYSHAHFKGCDILLAAIALARDAVPALRVIAYGSDEPVAHLPLPMGAQFHFCPPQDRIRDIYAACDAWLFGSRSEGFGLPLLEAMACRTPVIASAAGAAPELVADGAGVLLPIGDVSAMARAIVRFASMPILDWQEMSDAAYRTARRYSWDDATLCFEQALQHAIEKTSRNSTRKLEVSA